jgi:hypothetical protein
MTLRPGAISDASASVGRVHGPEGDVLVHGTVEDQGLLLDECDLTAKIGETQFPEVDPVEQQPPLVRGVLRSSAGLEGRVVGRGVAAEES